MSMSLAIEEAYASNPIDELVLDTLEFHHPAFVDEFGVRTGVRIVRDSQAWEFKLEDSAPLSPGQYVEFSPVPFEFSPPGFEEGQVPTLQLTVSNISRIITRYLELAIAQTTPIEVYFRPYLSSDTSIPQINPVIVMKLTSVTATTMSITGTATLSDVHNWPFPAKKYTAERFPGLMR